MSDERWGYPMYLSERVEELLREGTLTEIIQFVEKDLQEEWRKSPPQESETRERIYYELRALRDIQLKLEAIVQNLKTARGDF